jgi:4-hydroxyphenylpyruvate dioxygenase-like putative hemolysin
MVELKTANDKFWQKELREWPPKSGNFEEYEFYQPTETVWFLRPHRELLEEMGFTISEENLSKLINRYEESWVNAVYNLCALVGSNRANTDQYLNLHFNYAKNTISKTRYHTFWKKVIENKAPKEVFLPILEEYEQMGYFIPPIWDEIILTGYEWVAQQDDLVSIIKNIIDTNKDKFTPENTGKMSNWLMGEVIKTAKTQNKKFDVKTLKGEIENCLLK